MIEFLENWNLIFGFIISLYTIAIIFIGIFSENKYNLINRLKRKIAILRNKDVEISISFSYESEANFDKIKKTILEKFNNIDVKRETKTRIDFTAGSYSINLIQNPKNNIFIEVERIGCGIRGLKEKITNFLGILNDISNSEKPVLEKFLACDIDISLPFIWTYVNINKPKKFKLKKYQIELEEGTFKSQVKIVMDRINIKLNAKEAVLPVLEKFI